MSHRFHRTFIAIGLLSLSAALPVLKASADAPIDPDLLRLRNQAKQNAPALTPQAEAILRQRNQALHRPKMGKPAPVDLAQMRAQAKRNANARMNMDLIAWNRERMSGFKALFNGRSLDGWEPIASSSVQWKATQGALQFAGGSNCAIRTVATSDNFILRFQWRLLKPRGDAGMFLRAPRSGASGEAIRISLSDTPEAGSLVTGGTLVPSKSVALKSSQWDDCEVAANGSYVVVKVNGKVAAQTNAAPLNFGFIGFEAKGAPFQAQNIRIKELGWTPLFNGKSLAGWKASAPGHWVARADGVLAYDGKGGDLDTAEEFGDYDLRLDWRVGDKKYESGVYYRGAGYRKGLAAIGAAPAGSDSRAGYPAGAWNHYDIRVRNRAVSVWLNGERVANNVTFGDMPAQGPIALRNLGSPVQFRDIEIRKIGPAAKDSASR
jgi:hypothetical protein